MNTNKLAKTFAEESNHHARNAPCAAPSGLSVVPDVPRHVKPGMHYRTEAERDALLGMAAAMLGG